MDVYYGNVRALNDVSIKIDENEIVAIIGANGAGKTTLLKTIIGINKVRKGTIKFYDKLVSILRSHEIVKLGISYVPEGRLIFQNMSVRENLEMGAYCKSYLKNEYEQKLNEVLEIFPKLKERLKQTAGSLSGGEQQMLAIARGLMSDPKLLMLDEPSLGLAPVIVDDMFDLIVNINRVKNIPILLVEQNANMALKISQKGYVLENGKIKFYGKSSDLIDSPEVKKAYLGG
ncbi:MAG: ABC transporter ATP-binding protein [Thermoanaerobacterium sp.]|nr:ABC transporter ATP-binding protein [Thermoanaerobacterium sp.]